MYRTKKLRRVQGIRQVLGNEATRFSPNHNLVSCPCPRGIGPRLIRESTENIKRGLYAFDEAVIPHLETMSSSTMPAAGTNAVHTGFWIDHDQTTIAKPTLTLKNRDAVLLLAALSTIVGFAAGWSWKIWRFLLHYFVFKAGNCEEKAGISDNRAQQVILKNLSTAGSAIVPLLSFMWSRRHRTAEKTHHSLWSTAPLIVAALVHVTIFSASSVLVAQILKGRTVVSKVTPSCGLWTPIIGNDASSYTNANEIWLNQTLQAENYVRNCYDHGTSSGIFDCSKLVTRLLPFESHSVECPFRDNGCLNGTDDAFVMDSGNISFRDLGVNSKYAKNLFVRRRSTCAVMPEEPFLERVVTNADPGLEGLGENESLRWYNFLTLADDQTVQYMYRNDDFSAGYDLRAHIWPYNNTMRWKAPFHPRNSASDTSLILLKSTGVSFLRAADDPWFSAHTIRERLGINLTAYGLPTTNVVEQPYYADRFLNIIGCYEQAQLCNKNTDWCSPWGGLYSVPLTEGLLGMNLPDVDEREVLEVTNIAVMVQGSLPSTGIPDSISRRHAGAALQAAKFLAESAQTRLDEEQWKIELRYWFSMGLARLQLDIFESIERPPHVNESMAFNTWETYNLTDLCGRVKFRSPDHSSLSTVGIIVVLVGAVSLALASFFDVVIEHVPWWGKIPAFQAWQNNDALALLAAPDCAEGRDIITGVSALVHESAPMHIKPTFPKGY